MNISFSFHHIIGDPIRLTAPPVGLVPASPSSRFQAASYGTKFLVEPEVGGPGVERPVPTSKPVPATVQVVQHEVQEIHRPASNSQVISDRRRTLRPESSWIMLRLTQ